MKQRMANLSKSEILSLNTVYFTSKLRLFHCSLELLVHEDCTSKFILLIVLDSVLLCFVLVFLHGD